MMASQDLLRLLNRCITDQKFCDLLLAQPEQALQSYQLSEPERSILLTHTAENFYLLTSRLEELGLITSLNSSKRPFKS